MGAAMSPRQQQLLADRFRRIVLLLDEDAAGRKATRELGDRLGRAAKVYTVHFIHTHEGSQPGPRRRRKTLARPKLVN